MRERTEPSNLLEKPFPADAVCWKPQVVRNGTCLVATHLDARVASCHLDEIHPLMWNDRYTIISYSPERNVVDYAIAINLPEGHEIYG